jgi:hypothetical protein
MVAPVPAQISTHPRRKLSCPSRRSTPNSCRLILLQTLLHSQSRQPLWNQVNPNSFAKTPGVGVPRFPCQSPAAHYPPLTTHSPLTTFRINTYEKRGGRGIPRFRFRLPTARYPRLTFCRPSHAPRSASIWCAPQIQALRKAAGVGTFRSTGLSTFGPTA